MGEELTGVGGAGPEVGEGEGFVVLAGGGVVGQDGGVFVREVAEVMLSFMGLDSNLPGTFGSGMIVMYSLVLGGLTLLKT